MAMEATYSYRILPRGVVQREWDHTLQRLRAACTLQQASEKVAPGRIAYLLIAHTTAVDVAGLERILMDNLLFVLWTRTERDGTIAFAGEWLPHWRRAVPWRCDKVGGMARLAPGTPQHQWTYRFNIIPVEE